MSSYGAEIVINRTAGRINNSDLRHVVFMDGNTIPRLWFTMNERLEKAPVIPASVFCFVCYPADANLYSAIGTSRAFASLIERQQIEVLVGHDPLEELMKLHNKLAYDIPFTSVVSKEHWKGKNFDTRKWDGRDVALVEPLRHQWASLLAKRLTET